MRTRIVTRAFVSALVLAGALVAVSAASARGTGGTSGPAASIAGNVSTIDVAKKNITIKTSTGTSVKLAVGRSTAITRNGARSSLANLSLGDSITGQYKVLTLTATVLTASGPATTSVRGSTSNVSLASGVLSVGANQVQTSANTRIARNGQIVSLRQITSSDTLIVHVAMGTNVVLDVLADGPEESEVQGVISTIVGNSITIAPSDGSANVTITVGAGTLIEVNDDTPGALTDLQPGQTVEAEYDPTTLVAFSISVDSETDGAEVKGTVVNVDTLAGTVTIAPQGGGANITLVVNAATEIEVNGDGGALGDIQGGMPIEAEYDPTTLIAAQLDAGGPDD